MKLLIAADIFPPQSGGPATYAVTLANALTERGVDVRIVSLNPQSDRSVVSCILYLVSSKNKFLRYVQYLWLLLREARTIDVVYAMGPVNAGLPALFASWVAQKPLVVKVVGDYAWEQGVLRFGVTDDVDAFQKKQYGGAVGMLRRIEAFVVRRALRVIVPCKYLKGMVEGWGVYGNRVNVIYNAAALPAVVPVHKPAGERWIVTAGRLVPWKGMSALADVIAAIPDEGTKLKIIGDGPDREKIAARIRNLRQSYRVELLGQLSRDRALAVTAAADVFVLNSGYEGLSHVLLEAIQLGIPVVASRAGGNPELIPAGRLFAYNNREEIGEKILEALREGGTASNLGEHFTMEKMIDRTHDVLVSMRL